MEPFLCYLCWGDSEVATFIQVVHLEVVHLIVECIQVVVWISLPLITWYLGHLKSRRKMLFPNLPSEKRMIIIPYLLSSDDKVFNKSS